MAYVVTYTYSFDDYLALIRAKRAMGMFRGLGEVLHYILAAIAFLLVLAALTDWSTTTFADLLQLEPVAVMTGGIAGVCALIALIELFFDRVIYRLVFRRFALAGSELTVTVDGDGIGWSGAGIAANLAWSLAKRVHVARDHVFVFISKIEGLGLPRRALPSLDIFRELAGFVQARVGSAKPVAVRTGGRP